MEIDTELIIRQYDANLQNYEKLAESVQSLLVKSIKKHGVKTHSITSRIKEVASFLASSAESVGKYRYRQITKCMIHGCLQAIE